MSAPRGQEQLEPRALSDLGVEVDAPAEHRRELLRDREPEARASARLRDERPEEPLAHLRRDAGAGVLDGDVHGAVPLCELERDAAAVRRRVERVREEVPDDLQHAIAVGRDDGPRLHLLVIVDRPPARLFAEPVVRLVDELHHVDLLRGDREAVRVELREIEDVADEPLEPLRLGSTVSSDAARSAGSSTTPSRRAAT